MRKDQIVYVWFYPSTHDRFAGQPCYVGRGRPDRWKDHERGFNTNKHLRALFNKYGELPYVILRSELTGYEANELERALIKVLGRRDLQTGPLVNLTDGGDGTVGFVMPTEVSQRAADKRRGQLWWTTPQGDVYRGPEKRCPDDVRGMPKGVRSPKTLEARDNHRRAVTGLRSWMTPAGTFYLAREPRDLRDVRKGSPHSFATRKRNRRIAL